MESINSVQADEAVRLESKCSGFPSKSCKEDVNRQICIDQVIFVASLGKTAKYLNLELS